MKCSTEKRIFTNKRNRTHAKRKNIKLSNKIGKKSRRQSNDANLIELIEKLQGAKTIAEVNAEKRSFISTLA